MADKRNDAPAASEAPVQSETTAAPVTVVREKRGWATPLIAALVVVAALVVGGVGGFALAMALDRDGRPVMQQGQLPGQGQNGPQQGPGGQQGPGAQMGPGQGGQPPQPGDTSPEDDTDDETEEDSTEG